MNVRMIEIVEIEMNVGEDEEEEEQWQLFEIAIYWSRGQL